jgi:osmotically-inducible protein OsmY
MGKLHLSLAIVALVSVSGCASVATSGITGLGYSLAQERTVGGAIDDVTIGTKINSYFLRENQGKLFKHVAVEVLEGRVLLTGAVDTADDRVDAVRISWQAKGVKEVINEIQINDKSGIKDYARDIWITTQVKAKLFLNAEIKSINYSVDTVNGVSYIMGIAQDRVELNKVNRVSSMVKGVKKVVSHVRIKEQL